MARDGGTTGSRPAPGGLKRHAAGRSRTHRALRLALGVAWGVAAGCAAAGQARAEGVREDVQRIGLAPLYEALVAVANCPDLRINRRRFAAVARGYHLQPADLTPYGRFGPEILSLANVFAVRVGDDRDAFCSSARLSFAVVHGVLEPATPLGPRPPFPFRQAP